MLMLQKALKRRGIAFFWEKRKGDANVNRQWLTFACPAEEMYELIVPQPLGRKLKEELRHKLRGGEMMLMIN